MVLTIRTLPLASIWSGEVQGFLSLMVAVSTLQLSRLYSFSNN